jgi:hypothetical protein
VFPSLFFFFSPLSIAILLFVWGFRNKGKKKARAWARLELIYLRNR